MTPLSHLHSLTNRILDAPKTAYGELFKVTGELYEFLLQVTGIDANENSNRENIPLHTGKAIGVTWAAMCVKDIIRTKKFMDGIYEAVDNVLQKYRGRPVHILYAGTGPFATLLLPITARFTPSEVQFTFLEVNEYSFHCLQKLVTILNIEPYIAQMESADATSWTIKPENPFDIFISETMNIGLTKEPQVAIFMNIIPQLPPDAIIIPEKVRLQAALIDPVKQMKHKMNNEEEDTSVHTLSTVFELNRETVLLHAAAFKESAGGYSFPEITINIPADTAISHSQLCVLTDITVYNTTQLLIDESPLTIPLKLTEIKNPIPQKIKCHYETSENPGVQFSLLQ